MTFALYFGRGKALKREVGSRLARNFCVCRFHCGMHGLLRVDNFSNIPQAQVVSIPMSDFDLKDGGTYYNKIYF